MCLPIFSLAREATRRDSGLQIDGDVFAGPLNPKDGSAANIIGSSFYGFK